MDESNHDIPTGSTDVEDEVHIESQNSAAHGPLTSSTSNVQTIQKPVGRKGNCWNAFVFIDGIDVDPKLRRAQCFYCKKATYPADSVNGTSNMNKHLKKCKPYNEFLKTNGHSPQFTQTRFRELLSRAIIRHGYAFSWVEHEGNREIHAYLNNQVQSITKNTSKADCIKLHKTLRGELFKILQTVPGRICLTSDMWTSCQTEGYLCLTAHFVDAKWRLNSKVLNFLHIESPHSGYAMYSHVFALIRDWGIENKIFSITLDNASSNDKMQNYLRDSLNCQESLLCNGQFFHIRCAAHVLNLIVKDGLTMIEHSVEKIRKNVKYVKWSETRKQSFEAGVKSARITETKGLWLDVATRWNSTYMMLDRALLYRRAFEELSRGDDVYKKYLPDPNEWERVQKIRDILEPFCDITELFSGTDYPTANLYFENVWRIAMHLKELAASEDIDLRYMGIKMSDKFEKYWLKSDVYNVQEYNTLFAFAFILDPRYKVQCLKLCFEKLYKDEDVLAEVANVKLKLEKLFIEYMPRGSNNSKDTHSTSKQRSSKRSKFSVADLDTQDSSEVAINNKLDLYLKEPRLDRNADLNILEFWGENESKYGELSYMARDILSVPLTTVASESTFSIGGRILNKWRSSYLPENIEVLITARSWLHGYEAMDEECIGSEVDWTTKGRV